VVRSLPQTRIQTREETGMSNDYPPFDDAAFELADAQRKACGMSEKKRAEYLLIEMDKYHQTLINHDIKKSNERGRLLLIIWAVVMAIYITWELS